ncbi:MAG: DUF1894 domain-containing protein [Halobacteriota archaeon]
MLPRIDERQYEILLHDVSFNEGVKYVTEHSEEVYYVEPGYKIFGKRLVGRSPIPVGVARDRIYLIYITPPYYRGYVLELPRDEHEVSRLQSVQLQREIVR